MKELIVKQARTWIGTRFHHQGRVKKSTNSRGGCDCIGLILGVAKELNIKFNGKPLEKYDKTVYGKLQGKNELGSKLDMYFTKVVVANRDIGDIVLFNISSDNLQHVGILSDHQDGLGIIHCYIQARGVVEHYLSEEWERRLVGVYRFDYRSSLIN